MRIEQAHYQFMLLANKVASNDRPHFMPWEIDEFLDNAQWIFLKNNYEIDKLRNGFEIDQHTISELSNLHIKSPELQPPVIPINLGGGLYEVRLNELGNNINGQYFRYLFLTKGYVTIRKDNCEKKIRIKIQQSDDFKTSFNEPDWDWNIVHGQFGKSTFRTPVTTVNLVTDSLDRLSNLVDNPNLNNERFNNDELQSLYLDTNNSKNISQFEIINACINYIKYPNRVFIGGYDTLDKHSTAASPQIQFDIDEAFHADIVKIAVDLAMMTHGSKQAK